MRTLGVIPARGGSKGLPRKNILELCGKPLLCWTIDQALASESLDYTVVSTDDPEIASVAVAAGGCVPFLRPPELAQDTTPIADVVLHLLNELKPRQFDIVALLEPTSPLRRTGDIDDAVALLKKMSANVDAVISVGEVHTENPAICKTIAGDILVPYEAASSAIYQRQQMSAVYFPYGVVYAAKTSALERMHSFYPERAAPLVIERWQNYEIDDIYDFICVESIMRYRETCRAKL